MDNVSHSDSSRQIKPSKWCNLWHSATGGKALIPDPDEDKLARLLFAWLWLRAVRAAEVVRQVTNLMRPGARNGFNFHQQQTKQKPGSSEIDTALLMGVVCQEFRISFCSERNIMSVLCHLLLVLCPNNGLQFSKTINGAAVWAPHQTDRNFCWLLQNIFTGRTYSNLVIYSLCIFSPLLKNFQFTISPAAAVKRNKFLQH